MKIEFSEYSLISRESLSAMSNERKHPGALLKFRFSDDLIGYADCHPCLGRGDQPLEEQLKLLKNGITTNLTERSLFFAKIDAKGRFEEKSLLAGEKIPPSNLLITDITQQGIGCLEDALLQGYARIKLKLGRNTRELSHFKDLLVNARSENLPKMAFRLDFNATLTQEQFEQFIHELGDDLEYIEYFEDPFPFDHFRWQEMQQKYGIKLACDQCSAQAVQYKDAAEYIVVKPAAQSNLLPVSQKLVVTDYFDHPLGELAAAYTAAAFMKQSSIDLQICGLLSYKAFIPNPFSERMSSRNGVLVPPSGTGFGFDDLLAELDWREL